MNRERISRFSKWQQGQHVLTLKRQSSVGTVVAGGAKEDVR